MVIFGRGDFMTKTTIYLDENDLELLKTEAFISRCSVASLIRKSIKNFCGQIKDNQKIIDQLNIMRKRNDKYSSDEIQSMVDVARNEVREEKRKNKSDSSSN